MSDPLARLVGELSRLPGIGAKTATRLAHHLLKAPVADCRALADAIIEVTEKLFYCSVCNAITDVEPCRICTDPQRDQSLLCVVEEPFNIAPVERTGEFRGAGPRQYRRPAPEMQPSENADRPYDRCLER